MSLPPLPSQQSSKPDSPSEYSDFEEQTHTTLTPAQREARKLDLDLHPSPPLTQESRVVREYSTIAPACQSTSKEKDKHKALPQHIGTWTCCNCTTTHPIPTSISVLHCTCPHLPCEKCLLSGSITSFKPPHEPLAVPLDPHTTYGIICPSCGSSWPARTVVRKRRFSFRFNFMSSLLVRNLFTSPRPHPELRRQMEARHGRQVEEVVVAFGGRKCTCEEVLDAGAALCFKVQVEKEEEEGKGFGATERDREQGVGREVLRVRVKGSVVRHANPLMSCPV